MQLDLTGYVKAIDYDREASRPIMVTVDLDRVRGEITLFLDIQEFLNDDQKPLNISDLIRVHVTTDKGLLVVREETD